MTSDLSIHPRNWPGGSRVKRNTCEPRSKARFIRAIAGIQRHIENHPNDVAAIQRLANLKARAA